MGLNHMHVYGGDEDLKLHWFICEKSWDVANMTNEDKQMAQFDTSIRANALTWLMNFTKNKIWLKAEINNNFLTFFKSQDIRHLATHKLKEIKQSLVATVRE